MNKLLKTTLLLFVLSFVCIFGGMEKANADTLLSFNTNGGSSHLPVTVPYRSTVSLSSYNITKNGYDLAYWTLNSNNGNRVESITGEANIIIFPVPRTVYAHWTPTVYTITYDLDGGVADNPTSYTIESDRIVLNAPSRDGYVFKGWSGTELSGKSKFVAIPKGRTGNRSYTANWAKLYNLSFETNGGTSIDSEEIEENTDVDLSNYTTSREGYRFDGWYSDSALTNKVTSVTVTSDTTLYAKWVKTYTLTFDSNGGSSIESEDFDSGKVVNLDNYNPTREGYRFDGWYNGTSIFAIRLDSVPMMSNRTIHARWNPISYSINYNLNGGNVSIFNRNPVIYDIEDRIILNNPTRYGYTFKGWTGTGLDEATMNVVIPRGSTGNRSYTANWEINKYILAFETNGGSSIEEEEFDYNTTVYLSNYTPERKGYTFDGWFSDSRLRARDRVTSVVMNIDKKVYAKWTINKYKLTFDTNGGSSIDSLEKDYNTTIDLDSYKPSRKGYTFKGWYSDSDLTNEITSITLEDDTTIYAKWEINKYTLTFETNGGSFVNNEVFDYNTEVDLNNYTSSKEDNIFLGWYSDSDLTNKIISTILEDDTTVYAKWQFIYKIIKGEDQTYIKDSDKNVTIVCNGDLRKLVRIEIDGMKLEPMNYNLVSGSTILTLKSNYLNTLKVGSHNVKFIYEDGSCDTDLIVKKNNKTSKKVSENPNTGDNIINYICLLVISTLGITSLIKVIRIND